METQVKPEVGMGVTEGVGSDAYPYTIIGVVNDRKVVVQSDIAYPDKDNGYDYYGNQVYIYSRNPEGGKRTLTLRKNGRWKTLGDSMNGTSRWHLGVRRYYSDPSF